MRPTFCLARLCLCLGLALMAPAAQAQSKLLTFADLQGWEADDHQAALQSFLVSCDLLKGSEWGPICAVAQEAVVSPAASKAFFELFFRPVQIGSPPALFTGYFEPELAGSLTRTPRFAWPIYRRPPEVKDGMQWHDRATIERGILRGRGLEIAWLDDPVDVFFLHIQGSGRVRLPDGSVIRVGYGGRNGHAYRSVGDALVKQGALRADQVSAEKIRAFVRRNPSLAGTWLNLNPSYVFFRRLDDLPLEAGPIGAMGRSISTLRSVAVDPGFVPLGVPVWLEKEGRDPMWRLMVAQDTGGAIKGAQRADIFFGTGEAAGRAAGMIRDGGRMLVLLPIDQAYAMAAPESF
jgi:membrane-bound lytic murein transglycosylase A